MSDLKPCPFCGTSNEKHNNIVKLYDDEYYAYEYCNACGARVYANWNTRPIEDALRKEIAQLQADNRSLVEQMNQMVLKPNQEIIEYFYPKYNPITKRLENLPTKECLCIVELYSGEYEIVWWISAGFEETGWDGYCVDEVKSWAYLPKGVAMETRGKDE